MELVQGTQAWYEFRKKGVGASDVAAIIGVSPWQTPHMIWLDKTNRVNGFEGNAATLRGQEQEGKARALYELLTIEDMKPACVVHPKYEIVRASLDGISNDGKRILEIKVPGAEAHAMAKEGKVPEYYIPQIQWQLLATGADECDYFSFNEEDESHALIKVKPDLDYQAELLIKVQYFWETYVLKDVPPPLTERDVKVVTDDQALINLSTLIYNDHERMNKLELNKLKEQFVTLGGHNKVKCGKVQVSAVKRNGKFSYHKLTVEKEDVSNV